MNNRTTTDAWDKLERWIILLGLIVIAISANVAAYNWKHKHDTYSHCLALDASVYSHDLADNPYTDNLRRQQYNNQVRSEWTTEDNNCKQFLKGGSWFFK